MITPTDHPVYSRTEDGIAFYSPKDPLPQDDLDTLAKLKESLPEELYEANRAHLLAKAGGAEVVAPTLKNLEKVAETVAVLAPKYQQSKDAREVIALALLNNGESPANVQGAADVTWAVLAAWCYEKDSKSRRTGKILVPEPVILEIERAVEEAQRQSKKKTGKARAMSGGKSATRDDDLAYKHKVEELNEAIRDWEQASGVKYEPGTNNSSDELDALQTLVDNWF